MSLSPGAVSWSVIVEFPGHTLLVLIYGCVLLLL